MIHADLPPQTQEALALSQPRVEVVAEDTTKRDLEFGATGGLFVSTEGNFNPIVTGDLRYRGFRASTFADGGFVETPKRNGDLTRIYSETFISQDVPGPVRPATEFEISNDQIAARVGVEVPIVLDPANFVVRVYPASTIESDDGNMEAMIMLGGNVDLGKGFSVGVMGREFLNYDEGLARRLGIVRGGYKVNDRFSLGIEYRNFPTERENMAARANRGYLYGGGRLKF
jgi:hypothetical protein